MSDEFARAAFREREARRIRRKRAFQVHFAIYAAVNAMLVVVWAMVGGGHPWFIYPILGWGIGIVAHGASAYLMADTNDIVLEREQRRFAEENAESA